nr:DUF2147 domain-containing protein [Chthonobacter rhizosphaerae]
MLARALVVAAILVSGVAPSAAADATGVWARPNGASRIEISPCGGALCGRIVWMRSPQPDTRNPDPARRSEPLVGRRIMSGLKPTKKPAEWKGEIYNAEDGRTYTGYATLVGPDSLKLEGCVLGGLICKGETWTRAK